MACFGSIEHYADFARTKYVFICLLHESKKLQIMCFELIKQHIIWNKVRSMILTSDMKKTLVLNSIETHEKVL